MTKDEYIKDLEQQSEYYLQVSYDYTDAFIKERKETETLLEMIDIYEKAIDRLPFIHALVMSASDSNKIAMLKSKSTSRESRTPESYNYIISKQPGA